MRIAYSVVFALAFVVVSSPSRASVDGQDPQARPDKKDAPLPVTKPAPRPVTITRDGTVSIAATRLTLRAILDDISVQAKFPIVLAESLEEERVSLQLGGVSLEEGLKRLLAAYDAFYLFSPSEKEKLSPSIRGIWVYPKGEGLELQPVAPALWASTKELEAQLDDPDPGVRSHTFEALIERQGARGLPIVLRGLADSDDAVRLTTLATALNVGVEIPAADLHALVLSDPLQGIRLRALEAIETRPEASAIAESVKDDPDEVIRNTAALLLKRLQDRNTKKPPG
jgi:HEAT repeat protein